MKKSNKGFTLIELLAAIVLLGILFIFAAPQITGLVNRNRDKMYITDAQKLMAQAEYKIKSANSKIDKPNPDDCIVISLLYLDDSDFETAPNRGEYLKEASYVVIKNDNGRLEYSVAIVEELEKGGYKGIELTSGDNLREANATRFVKGIDKNDLVLVSQQDKLTPEYINNRISKGSTYVTAVNHYYNEPEMDDDASRGGLEAPNITKATLTSTSGKDYNSLDATLTLTVEDKDTPGSKLTVFLSTESYEDATAAGKVGENYGTKNAFVKKFDFGTGDYHYNYDDNSIVYLYIVVKDKEGNEDKTTIIYRLHQNMPPVVTTAGSGFFKLVTDKVNRTTALFKLNVSDDIDDVGDLMVCFNEDVNAETCSNYKKYSTLFVKNGNEMEYPFESNACALNGQTKTVRVFVKDSKNEINKEHTFSYTIANNGNPIISSATVTSEVEGFMGDSITTGSKNVRIKVDGSDDVSYNSNIKVDITSANSTSKHYDSFDPNTEMEFTLGGTYDGTTRAINIKLTDECGKSSTVTRNYTLYANQPPKVKNIQVESNGVACRNDEECPISAGGNQKATVFFDLTDDLDYSNLEQDVLVCISENKADCTADKTSNFKPYANYIGGYTYTFNANVTHPYDGSEKTVYVIAKDKNNATNYNDNSSNSVKYKLYKNKFPKVTDYEIKSEPKMYTASGSLDARIVFNVADDIDTTANLKYTIGTTDDQGHFVYKGGSSTPQPIDPEELSEGIPYRLPGTHNGAKKNVVLKVYDTYSSTQATEQTYTYTLYQNQPPQIFAMGIPKVDNEQPAEFDGEHPDDKNSNGIDDVNETFTIRYKKGAHGLFNEDVLDKTLFTGYHIDDDTPEYDGDFDVYQEIVETPGDGEEDPEEPEITKLPKTEKGWVFVGWAPYYSDIVLAEMATGGSCGTDQECEIIYTAKYKVDANSNGIPDDEELKPNFFNITPKTGTCHSNYICPYLVSGNPKVEVDFDIEDDIDSEEENLRDLLVCISERASDCERKQVCDSQGSESTEQYVSTCLKNGKYVRYSKFVEAGKIFEFNATLPLSQKYDGGEHNLFVYAMDSEGMISNVKRTYKVYENQKPTIVAGSVSVESALPNIERTDRNGNPIVVERHSKDVIFTVDATDDYDLPLNLQVKLCYKAKGSNSTLGCTDYVDYNYDHKYPLTMTNATYNGGTYQVYAIVKDSLGRETSPNEAMAEYVIFRDKDPVINSVEATYVGGMEYDPNAEQEEENPGPDPNPDTVPVVDDGDETYIVRYTYASTDWNKGDFTRGVDNATVFRGLNEGDPTPAYAGETITYPDGGVKPKSKANYTFYFWNPGVEETVNADDAKEHVITYTAVWALDENGNGVADVDETTTGTSQEWGPEAAGKTQGAWVSTDKPKLIVSVVAEDMLDTYRICITQSNNSNTCKDSDYVGKQDGTGFSGDDLKSGIVHYVKDRPEDLKYYKDGGATFTTYYAFIKDSHNKVSQGVSFEGVPHTDCEKVEDVESAVVATFKGDILGPDAGTEISAASCGGMCYFAEAGEVSTGDEVLNSERLVDTSGIKGKYDVLLRYADRINGKLCDGKVLKPKADPSDPDEYVPDVTEKEYSCSYIDCFRHPGHVSDSTFPEFTMAIGMRRRTMPREETIPETDLEGATTYDGQDYYMLYSVSYDGVSESATLTPTGKKIPVPVMEAENTDYNFVPTNKKTYVRVRD